MKELLKELKQLDPACYEDIRRRVIYDMDEDFKLYVTNQTFRENVDDTIQGCVQRVVAARGWHFDQGYTPKPIKYRPNYHASIYRSLKLDDPIWEGEGDSPAKAILTCYLAARKAQT